MNAIVCCNCTYGIGKENRLLYSIKDDMSQFIDATTDNIVVMGKKTQDSIPGGKLKGRQNIIITSSSPARHAKLSENTGLYYINRIDDLKPTVDKIKEEYGDKEVWVIGGSQIYKQLVPFCNKIRMTMVYDFLPADSYFPNPFELGFEIYDRSGIQTEEYFDPNTGRLYTLHYEYLLLYNTRNFVVAKK